MTAFPNSRGRLTAPRAALSWLLSLTLLLLAIPAFAQTPVPAPPTDAPVLDLTGTLRPEETAALKSRLLEFEKQKGSQIAVLIVPTTGDEAIEQYSIRVADQWKVGRAAPDDGVILVVAKNDRAVRIEVGTGLEGALPDVIASRIISQVIVPHFREGDFSGGINAAVTRIIAVIEGEPLPEAERRSSRQPQGSGGIGNALPILLMFVFVGSGILRGMLGRVGGAGATAGIAGVLMWILTSIMAISIGAAVLAFLFALFTGGGGGGGRGWSNHRRGGGGWGGGFGGGGFGGGGGGGWSGGGGGFSGGGASGRW
jgi:uncharacterized protein